MSDLQLTKEQNEAIFSSGHNILVSASAGSGKTFVMANRIVEKVKAGFPIDGLFISTFTKKAAEELRARIEKDLKKAQKTAENDEIRRRISLALQNLSSSDIGTMDSFNQKVLKTHFNRVNLDPNFRILADKTESDVIKQEVFDQLLEEYLLGNGKLSSENFEKLVKNFSNDRNFNGFQDVVYEVYNYISSIENPMKWLENEFLNGFEHYQKFTDLPNEFTTIEESLQHYFQVLENGLAENAFTVATKEKIEIWLDNKENLLSNLTKHQFTLFTELYDSLQENAKLNGNNFKGNKSKELGINVEFQSFNEVITTFLNEIRHVDLIEKYQPQAQKIADDLRIFVADFYQKYLERKITENAFEYSDISHFVIQILSENADVAQFYRDKYHEIMIDEYQDTNHLQETMLRLLSKNGDGADNLFMVGDIKQSIYGFRQADPSLFLQKYEAYDKDISENQLIRLKENFRSRGEVLNFTNKIFQHLMNKAIGEMNYGTDEKLVQGNFTDYPAETDENFYPELLIYQDEKSSDENEENISSGEIRVAAERIKTLIDSGISPSDIAILVRSKTNNNKIEDILKNYDIPVVLDEGRVDFLKSMEILVMLDVLRTIDNPLYDLSLVATLRSPMFNFNEEDLAQISLQSGNFFYEKLSNLTGFTLSLQRKISDFQTKFTVWCKRVNEISIYELLWEIYRETYYFDYVGALPNGEMRQANLKSLAERAESYEKSGYKGLFKFIKMLEQFMAQNNDLASVNIKLPSNAVRVMTFHKSKGLEFDHVFLMNLQTRFNTRDLTKSAIFSRQNGIGIQYLADFKSEIETDFPFAPIKMETFPYRVNRDEKRLSAISEEMRVLYVAMTRAKQKLYMIGKSTTKNLDNYLDIELENGLLPDKYRLGNSFQNWLLALNEAIDLPLKVDIIKQESLQQVDKQFTGEPSFSKLLDESVKFDGVMEQSDEIQKARQIMNFEYPNLAATQLSSIQTPSQVKKRAYEKILEAADVLPTSEFQTTKSFELLDLSKKKITAAEIGTAVHEFMQEVDFAHADLFSLQALLDESTISDELKKHIDIVKILTLFDTELGQILQKNADKIVKEAPFSMLRKDKLAKENYVIRGICDGFVKFDDKIILFDYKTDRFTGNIEEIKARYQIQMELYAEALQLAYKVDKVEKHLILLGGKEKVEIAKYE